MVEIVLDGALALLVLWIGWRCLSERDAFSASVTFIAFGLALALAWARLGAPDVALAEAALGAGITGALLIDAARELGGRRARGSGSGDGGRDDAGA